VPAGIPHLPLLSEWHRIADDDDRLVLEYGGEAVCLEGRATRALLPALLPLLDGTRTIDDIVLVLGEPTRPAVAAAVELLAREGVLTDGPPLAPNVPAPFAAFARATAAECREPPTVVTKKLRSVSAAVVGSGAGAAEAIRLLRLSGVGTTVHRDWDAAGADAGLTIVAPGRGEQPRLQDWNEAALTAGSAWLQLLPYDGAVAAIGPLFIPNETCCYDCYRRRRASNIDYPDEYWSLQRAPDCANETPTRTAVIAALGVEIALRWLLFADPFVTGILFALELGREPQLSRHVVYRLPRCPACSPAARLAAPRPWAEAEAS
jgi:bacteriocin biosynthesis cyclodehydratase domain-containing protein